jgi:hypothetical protein
MALRPFGKLRVQQAQGAALRPFGKLRVQQAQGAALRPFGKLRVQQAQDMAETNPDLHAIENVVREALGYPPHSCRR